MAGTLYVVATPIGNLEDITLRALRVLGEVSVVAAEDTRRTGHLLRHFNLSTRLVSVREHNEQRQAAALLECLERGESVALVTDAGTPGIADPGSRVVRAAVAAGVRVEPIPGPSAVMAALSVAGVDVQSFVFLGFPPIRDKDRKPWFSRLRDASAIASIVFFEAPHRIRRTLEDLQILSVDQILVFRELTKMHESAYRGSPAQVLEAMAVVAGEFTVVVPPRTACSLAAESASDSDVVQMFGQITDLRGREAARLVGERTGRSANEVYELVRRHKG